MERVKIKWVPQPKRVNEVATRIQRLLGGNELLRRRFGGHTFSYSKKNSFLMHFNFHGPHSWTLEIQEIQNPGNFAPSPSELANSPENSATYSFRLWKPVAKPSGVLEFETIQISDLDGSQLLPTLMQRTGVQVH